MKSRLLNYEKLKFEVRDVMRYDDVGDYYDHRIIAYDMQDPIINNAILLHEFIEYTLITSAGISPELIDKFDTDEDSADEYPREYELYGKFHAMANKVEKQFIENLGLNWKEYDKSIYTAKVKTAVQKITDELHKKVMSESSLEKSISVVKETFENSPQTNQKKAKNKKK